MNDGATDVDEVQLYRLQDYDKCRDDDRVRFIRIIGPTSMMLASIDAVCLSHLICQASAPISTDSLSDNVPSTWDEVFDSDEMRIVFAIGSWLAISIALGSCFLLIFMYVLNATRISRPIGECQSADSLIRASRHDRDSLLPESKMSVSSESNRAFSSPQLIAYGQDKSVRGLTEPLQSIEYTFVHAENGGRHSGKNSECNGHSGEDWRIHATKQAAAYIRPLERSARFDAAAGSTFKLGRIGGCTSGSAFSRPNV